MIIIFLTTAALGFLGATIYISPMIWRLFRMAAIRKEITDGRILALTYDDGPSESLTPRLLDLLREYEAKATFFMIGKNAKQFPEIVDRVIREGHAIGCHSEKHLNAWKSSPWNAITDIEEGFDSLSPWIEPNGMFRPPYGKMTLPTFWAIYRRHSTVWWWTVNSKDTFKVLPDPAEVKDSVCKNHGGIVLFHDMERPQDRNDFVLATTAALLNLARQERLNVETLVKLSK
jgi:peptidoglycan/xylan/chitin deacetylase (PgdA/CDA1 family)